MKWRIELTTNQEDQAAATRRLRAALKYLGRVFGLRCTSAVELKADGTHDVTTETTGVEHE